MYLCIFILLIRLYPSFFNTFSGWKFHCVSQLSLLHCCRLYNNNWSEQKMAPSRRVFVPTKRISNPNDREYEMKTFTVRRLCSKDTRFVNIVVIRKHYALSCENIFDPWRNYHVTSEIIINRKTKISPNAYEHTHFDLNTFEKTYIKHTHGCRSRFGIAFSISWHEWFSMHYRYYMCLIYFIICSLSLDGG